jgi:hypothetical protein
MKPLSYRFSVQLCDQRRDRLSDRLQGQLWGQLKEDERKK